MWTKKLLAAIFLLSFCGIAHADLPPLEISDEGTTQGRPVFTMNCVGAGVSCARSGTTGTITVSGGGVGDVVGPGSATDNAIVRFDSTTGKLIQNSNATIDDTGNVVFSGTATVAGTAQSTITEGLVVNNASGTDEDDDFTMKVSGGAYEIDAGAGTFTSTANDMGWTIIDPADNIACTTSCTSACVFGIQNASGIAVTNLVSCSDATADLCACAGAS